jgi:hypothetical protein
MNYNGGRPGGGPGVLEELPSNEEERSMGDILLHNPWVRFYVFYVAALLIVWIWNYIHEPRAIPNDPRTTGPETANEVEPRRGGGGLTTPTNPAPAPRSTNRRDDHVLTT